MIHRQRTTVVRWPLLTSGLHGQCVIFHPAFVRVWKSSILQYMSAGQLSTRLENYRLPEKFIEPYQVNSLVNRCFGGQRGLHSNDVIIGKTFCRPAHTTLRSGQYAFWTWTRFCNLQIGWHYPSCNKKSFPRESCCSSFVLLYREQ